MNRKCLTCCIIILILILLFGGAVAYVAIYLPKPATIVEKIEGQGVDVGYVGAGEEPQILGSEDMALLAGELLMSFAEQHTDINFTGAIFFATKIDEGAEDELPEVYGIIIFTDSIKSAAQLAVDFYKDSSENNFPKDYHASIRGKAFFVGNMKAELAFRKVIF